MIVVIFNSRIVQALLGPVPQISGPCTAWAPKIRAAADAPGLVCTLPTIHLLHSAESLAAHSKEITQHPLLRS